jgi:hypothetical protein
MPTKPIERLLFIQGNKCFFCNKKLARGEASIEHLWAKSKGGPNGNGNCVSCCVSLNRLFGDMTLAEKFKVVLNQNGKFKCPNSS